MNRDKSIIRSKKTAVTVGDLLGKELLTTFIPGSGLVYELVKALINHGRQYYLDRTESRLEEFHLGLLNGIESQEEYSDFINKPFDLDDYYALLASCVQDIENEKVEIYSQLMRGLIGGELDPEMRRHFVKACQKLTYSELCFLKDLYIYSKHDLMTVGGIQEQIKTMLSTHEPLRRLAIEKLMSSGFIDKEERNITSMGEKFISIIFPSGALSPEAVGRKPFSGINVGIISYRLGEGVHSTIAMEIQRALWECQIKSCIHILDNERLRISILRYKAAILIVDNQPIDPEFIEPILQFSDKRALFRLNVDASSKK
ncbi:hypothetical protein [Candidatus Nitrospira salsa]